MTRGDEPEEGSAIAEFVMVSAVLVLMFLACLQIAFSLHVRNTVLDAAATGARYGALRDVPPEAGVERTREIITAQLPERYASDVSMHQVQQDGLAVLEIRVTAPLPAIGLWGVSDGIEVSGHALLPQ